jgi:methylated-DNA-[protein]-cysteine S-methyltransferase
MTWIGKTDTTPLGIVWVAVSKNGLVAVTLNDQNKCFSLAKKLTNTEPRYSQEHVQDITEQIARYLAKDRSSFDCAIDWSIMTPFQQHVLKNVFSIPYGFTCSYGDIARSVGQPRASRAVGRANATNPIALIIPCHRVISADGSLGGYSAQAGLATKAWLLALEKSAI